MNPPAAPDYFDLSDYLGVLRRRWLSIIAMACLGAAAAAAFIVVGPKQYTATVLVQVNALPNNANAVGGRTGGPVNMDNEAQVAQSTAVAAIVRKAMHSPLPVASIVPNISVTVPPNSTFLAISYTAPSAQAAQLWANEVGRGYLFVRRVNTAAVIGNGISALRNEEAKLRATIERLKVIIFSTRHNLRRAEGSPVQIGDELQLASAQSAITAAQAHIDAAMPLYDSLIASHSVIAGNIVTAATLPTSPSSPRKALVLPSGVLAGLIVGLGLTVVRERRDKRIRMTRDLERVSSAPPLLDLTTSPPVLLATIEPPQSRTGELFAELARHISAELGGGRHVVAVAATAEGPGGSTVAANLAAALARTSDETVLVCGDLLGTEIPALTGIARGPGLSEVLAGSAAPGESTVPLPSLPRLRVLGPGLDPDAASAAMRYSTIKQVVADLFEGARYVVVEVQSAGEEAGSFSLAELAETAVVVVEAGRSDPADVTGCMARLELLSTPVLGTVIVPARRSARAGGNPRVAQRPSGNHHAPRPGAGQQAPPVWSDLVTNRRHESGSDWQHEARPVPALSPTAAAWTASTPSVAGEAPEVNGGASPRQAGETWPLPRVHGNDRDRFPDPSDPGTSD